MRKIFTLLAGMLLACSLTANAVEVTVYVCEWDEATEEYVDIAKDFTTDLTKSEDGVYTLADVTNTKVPLSFTFPAVSIGSYKGLEFTGTNLYRSKGYEEYPYLLDSEGDYAVCKYKALNSDAVIEVTYPEVYENNYSWIERYDPSESEYEYWGYICIGGYGEDDSDFDAYLMFGFNDPSEANQTAYDKVIADIESIETKYKDAVAGLEKEYEGIDLSEWDEIIGGQLAQVKLGASQALAGANANLEEFNFPFDAEEYEGMIAEMEKQAPIYAAYQKVVAEIAAVEDKYNEAVDEIKEFDPDFDFGEYKEIIEKDITFAKTGAETALYNAIEDGEDFSFPFGAEDIEASIIEMKKAAFADYNQEAYAKVLAELNAVEAQYNDAVAAIKAGNPDFDFTEWSEIANMIAQARSYAATAFELAEETGDKFNFLAGVEDIENFISEMKNADPQAYNKGAYEQVLAAIQEVEEEYNDAVEEIKEVNPEFDLTEWTEIIGNPLGDAKKGAEQALASATEDGETFMFPFEAEYYESMITEMKNVAFAEYNQKAYDKVVADIDELEAKYKAAVAEIEKDYPEFDLTEWKDIIGKPLGEAKNGAEQALASATEDGGVFMFPFDAEYYEGMIQEMKNDAKTSGIANIESEVAAGKAMIFTLDGKSHAAPVHGEVNVIVKGNSTVKVMIK